MYVCMQWMCVCVHAVNVCMCACSECVCMCACSEYVYVCMQWPSGSVLCWDSQPGWRNQPQDQAGTLDVHHISLTCTNILMHLGGGGWNAPPPLLILPPLRSWDIVLLAHQNSCAPFCLHPTFAPQSWMQPWTCIHHTHNYIYITCMYNIHVLTCIQCTWPYSVLQAHSGTVELTHTQQLLQLQVIVQYSIHSPGTAGLYDNHCIESTTELSDNTQYGSCGFLSMINFICPTRICTCIYEGDCLGCAVLLCLVCLFDLACFFLSSFSSLIKIYMYMTLYM